MQQARWHGHPGARHRWQFSCTSLPLPLAEVSTPTDFGAADSMGRLRWPNYPPTAFVTMEACWGTLWWGGVLCCRAQGQA